MLRTICLVILAATTTQIARTQCDYIPSTAIDIDTVTYTFSNVGAGAFQSYGCDPVDPTYWMAGSGMWAQIEYVTPEDYPAIRVWGMNDDDSASVTVNGVAYQLNSITATYTPKVVCGDSFGPDGIIFVNDKIVGANTNAEANYSYQDIYLNTLAVNTIMITGVSGAGWGFCGILIDCEYPGPTGLQIITDEAELTLFPNPLKNGDILNFNRSLNNATVEIYDLQGKLVFAQRVNGNNLPISSSQCPAGLYNVVISEEGRKLSTLKVQFNLH